jgi:hypothetical protein
MIKEIQGSRNILIIVHWITASQENRKMCKFTISIITFSSYFVRSDFYRTVWSTITWTYRPLNYRNVGLKPHAAQQVIMYNVITISLCTFTHEISCYDLQIKLSTESQGPVNIVWSKVKIEMTSFMCFLQSNGDITTIISYQTQKNYNLNWQFIFFLIVWKWSWSVLVMNRLSQKLFKYKSNVKETI